MGARGQRPGLEVGQQARVLLGLLGDAVDRGLVARLLSRQRGAGGPAARRLGVDRVAVRARLGMAEQLVELRLDARRDRALEPLASTSRLGPAEADDRGEQPLEQRVAAEDRVRRRPPGGRSGRGRGPSAGSTRPSAASRRNISLAAWVVTPSVAADLGGGRPGAVGGHHAQREQVLLGGRRDVGGVVPALQPPGVRAGRSAASPQAAGGRATPTPTSQRGPDRDRRRASRGPPWRRPRPRARSACRRDRGRRATATAPSRRARSRDAGTAAGAAERARDDSGWTDRDAAERRRVQAPRTTAHPVSVVEQRADAEPDGRPRRAGRGAAAAPAGRRASASRSAGPERATRLEVGQRLGVARRRRSAATRGRVVAAAAVGAPRAWPAGASPAALGPAGRCLVAGRAPRPGSAPTRLRASAPVSPPRPRSRGVPASSAVVVAPAAAASAAFLGLDRGGAPGPRLVLGAVLAGIGVLARVDRPVRARDGPYQAAPCHSGSSGVSRGLVVGGRSRGRLAGRLAARWRSPRRAPSPPSPAVPAPCVRRSRCPRGPAAVRRRPAAPVPAAAVPPRGVPAGSRAGVHASVRPPRLRSTPARRRRAAAATAQPPLAVDEPLVGRLDRQEPRQRPLARRVGVVLLGEPPVGAT